MKTIVINFDEDNTSQQKCVVISTRIKQEYSKLLGESSFSSNDESPLFVSYQLFVLLLDNPGLSIINTSFDRRQTSIVRIGTLYGLSVYEDSSLTGLQFHFSNKAQQRKDKLNALINDIKYQDRLFQFEIVSSQKV